MDFGLLPPEINSGLIYAGPGPGPMLANAANWDALAVELESAASNYSAQIAGLTGQAWLGPSSLNMATAAGGYVEWLQASATQAEETAAQASAAAAAYTMTVPPELIAANRAEFMVLTATNFFGQNTAAIAATEAEYMEMWIQDATAMYAYATDSEAAATLTTFDEPPPTTNDTGALAQADAVAQATAETTSTQADALTQVGANLLDGDITVGPFQTLPIGPGQTLSVDLGGSVVVDNGGSPIVDGGTVTVNGSLIVNGEFTVESGTVTVYGTLTINSGGTVTVNGGTVYAFNSGLITINSGGVLTISPSGGLSRQRRRPRHQRRHRLGERRQPHRQWRHH